MFNTKCKKRKIAIKIYLQLNGANAALPAQLFPVYSFRLLYVAVGGDLEVLVLLKPVLVLAACGVVGHQARFEYFELVLPVRVSFVRIEQGQHVRHFLVCFKILIIYFK